MDKFTNNTNKITGITLEQFQEIANSSYDGIFVTDNTGEIIFCNQASAIYLEKPIDYVVGKSVRELIEEGTYNNSVIIDAIKEKRQVTGLVKMSSGKTVLSTCTPIFNNSDDLTLTVTNVRVDSILDTYLTALKNEKNKVSKYKSVVNYLVEVNSENKRPIAESDKMKSLLKYAEKISHTDSVVLLLGESGTGKDIFARYIHSTSHRSNEPYISVNCAAIPENLMESEFFGYEKGAFSGATNSGKPGYFELADHGTLFLDEIGDMSLPLQSKLLRVIETGEVLRLGATETIKTNVRIIAATNKNLYEMVENNEFREDLYYRLNIIPLKLPPLRDRKKDIIALANYFLEIYNKKYRTKKILSSETINKLVNYSWPGNIRELKNIIERISIVSEGNKVELTDACFSNKRDLLNSNIYDKEINSKGNIKGDIEQSIVREETLRDYLDKVEEEYINQVMKECDGVVADAADILGIHRTMLYRKLKKYENK